MNSATAHSYVLRPASMPNERPAFAIRGGDLRPAGECGLDPKQIVA